MVQKYTQASKVVGHVCCKSCHAPAAGCHLLLPLVRSPVLPLFQQADYPSDPYSAAPASARPPQYPHPIQIEGPFSLAIDDGVQGSRLSHDHSKQYHFCHQSLTLWRNIARDMFRSLCQCVCCEFAFACECCWGGVGSPHATPSTLHRLFLNHPSIICFAPRHLCPWEHLKASKTWLVWFWPDNPHCQALREVGQARNVSPNQLLNCTGPNGVIAVGDFHHLLVENCAAR